MISLNNFPKCQQLELKILHLIIFFVKTIADIRLESMLFHQICWTDSPRTLIPKASSNYSPAEARHIQGDTARCLKPPVDLKT